jgi:hypothetical protein
LERRKEERRKEIAGPNKDTESGGKLAIDFLSFFLLSFYCRCLSSIEKQLSVQDLLYKYTI